MPTRLRRRRRTPPPPALTVLLTFRPWLLVAVLINFFIMCFGFGCCFVLVRTSIRSSHWWFRGGKGAFEKIWNFFRPRREGVSPAAGGQPSQRGRFQTLTSISPAAARTAAHLVGQISNLDAAARGPEVHVEFLGHRHPETHVQVPSFIFPCAFPIEEGRVRNRNPRSEQRAEAVNQ